MRGRTYRSLQTEGQFSQPNAAVCQHMLTWADDALADCGGQLTELYCGNGNFTIPLARNFDKVGAPLAGASDGANTCTL